MYSSHADNQYHAHRLASHFKIRPARSQMYQAHFEGFLEKFLDEAGCTAEEFVTAAQGASGMNEIYLQIFLAQVASGPVAMRWNA